MLSYDPPVEVEQLAAETTMNDYGKRLFYVHKPEISDRETFNTQCTMREQTIVLGCYTGTHIYVFDVEDERLNGIEQVTAAHEMLHAAYSRLSASERERIDKLIAETYNQINDPRIIDLAKSYEQQDPTSVPNELHSIIGTEVSNIGDELEEYYRRYFDNRLQIVAYATAYQQVFDDLKNQVAAYDAELSVRKTEIENHNASLTQQKAQIDQLSSQLYTLLDNGQIKEYNSLVPTYNNLVNAYNNEVNLVRSLIEQYNSIVLARNAIVVEQHDLAQSIDSRPSAITE